MSYYASGTIADQLSLSPTSFIHARQRLIHIDLIAFSQPLYQVLSLDTLTKPTARTGRPQSLGSILKQALEKSA